MNIYLAAWFIKYGDPDADFDRISKAEWIAGRYIRENGMSEYERIKSEVRTVDGEPCLLLRAMLDGVLPTPPTPPREPPAPGANPGPAYIRYGKSQPIDESEKQAVIEFIMARQLASGRKNIDHRKTIAALNANGVLINGRRWQRPAFASFLANHFR